MKLKDGRITMLADRDNGFTIELVDNEASTTFVRVHLTADQFMAAMARLGYTPCTIEVMALDRVGKKHEHKAFAFEMPECDWKSQKETAKRLVTQKCPEGWIPDIGFSSQNSFFKNGDKNMARTIIRRYI